MRCWYVSHWIYTASQKHGDITLQMAVGVSNQVITKPDCLAAETSFICVAPITHVRNEIVTAKGGHLMW